MPGKKAKKGSGKKKKGGKKKKDEVTWGEALMAYKISIKEKALEDVRYEVRALEEKKERHTERNDRLKEEQDHYMKLLLKQAREFDTKLSEQKPVIKSDVLAVMQEKWDAARLEEKQIEGLKEHIAKTEAEIIKESSQVSYWIEYKNFGQHEHKTQITVLEKELRDIIENFEEMSAYLNKSLQSTKETITTRTEEEIDKQKHKASERAIAKMDKNSRQEIMDNEWLKKEVSIHREDVESKIAAVEELEKANLKIMAELFECSVEDLKISRSAFLTQVDDGGNLEDYSLLEMDMDNLSFGKKKQLQALEAANDARPKSTTFLAIERKLMKKVAEEDDAESIFDDKLERTQQGQSDYLAYEEDPFEDYLRLGPLELKLLNVEGHAMTLFKLQTPTPDEEAAKDYNPEEYPVTAISVKQILIDGDKVDRKHRAIKAN